MSLDRMKTIETCDILYTSPGDFNPADFFKYSFGITQVHGAKAEKIVLSFTPAQAQYILAQPMHHSQAVMLENAEEMRIQMEVYITQELIMAVLSYGAKGTVLKPAHFRKRIKDLATEMSAHYK